MDDLTVDDEKKPFDELGAQNDEDPDEHLMLESGHGRVWFVKVSKSHYFSKCFASNKTLPDPKISDGALVKVRYRGGPTG